MKQNSFLFKGLTNINKMDYNSKTVNELQVIAKQSGLARYSRLRKVDLVELMSNEKLLDASVQPKHRYSKTVKELHAIAKQSGLTRYSRLRKADLIKLMLSEKLLDIFEPININIRESKSAIKGFTKRV